MNSIKASIKPAGVLILIFVLIVVITTLCKGCTPPTSPSVILPKSPFVLYVQTDGETRLINAEYIKRLFRDQVSEKAVLYGTVSFIIRDRTYAVSQATWLKQEFCPWFAETASALGVLTYSGANDCDKHAALFRLLSAYANLRTAKPAAQALAIGEVYYTRSNGGRHAVNMAVVSARDEIIFIEPQTGDQVWLSKKEMDSIEMVLM